MLTLEGVGPFLRFWPRRVTKGAGTYLAQLGILIRFIITLVMSVTDETVGDASLVVTAFKVSILVTSYVGRPLLLWTHFDV